MSKIRPIKKSLQRFSHPIDAFPYQKERTLPCCCWCWTEGANIIEQQRTSRVKEEKQNWKQISSFENDLSFLFNYFVHFERFSFQLRESTETNRIIQVADFRHFWLNLFIWSTLIVKLKWKLSHHKTTHPSTQY